MKEKAKMTEKKSTQYDETDTDLAQSVPDAEIHLTQPSENEGDSDNENDSRDNTREAISIDQLEAIARSGSVTAVSEKGIIHCLTIIGQIEGHYTLPSQNKTTKYEHVIPQLVAIEEDEEIEAGLAIAELIAGMSKPTVSLVLGGGHSIGVPLAVSAKMSFIVPSATMTIHPVRMSGLVLGVPETLSYIDKMQERITRFVTDNSSISGERFKRLMMNVGELITDVGTVLEGNEAVESGLIDRLGGLSDALSALYQMIDEKRAEKKK